MTFIDTLRTATTQNQSMLCVGLDPEPSRFPSHMKGDASKIYDFCAAIVDATADLVCSFKPQIAYFAAYRAEDQLERLMEHMRRTAPQVPVILDAKRGDIGSTAQQYAKEAFERYGADAVTLSPFMGFDSITPYLKYEGKGAFLLCRTSNPGGDDLQTSDDAYEIYTDAKSFTAVRDALEKAGYQLAVSELTMVPQNTTPVPADKKEQFEKLVDALEDDDDVSNVYTAAADEEE